MIVNLDIPTDKLLLCAKYDQFKPGADESDEEAMQRYAVQVVNNKIDHAVLKEAKNNVTVEKSNVCIV